MSNVALCKKDGTILYFIKDCIQYGNRYVGSNCKIIGGKSMIEKWTTDEAFPSYDIKGNTIGWDRKMEDLSDIDEFEGRPVSKNEDVSKVIREKIAEKYSIEDEIKILRMKLEESIDNKVWEEYTNYVNDLIRRGGEVKNTLSEEQR
jgi:hypothetical protein